MKRLFGSAVVGVALVVPVAETRAGPPPEVVASAPTLGPLLVRLAGHGERFERMKTHADFTVVGHMEKLDGDGAIDETRDLTVRITAPRPPALDPDTDIVAYTVDGKDERDEARKKSAERKAKRAKERAKNGGKPPADKRDFHLPFLASEQPRYVFGLAERHPARADLVRVTFVPREPAEDAYKGSAWVNVNDGEVESMGLSFSKNPTFVDHVEVSVVFGLKTALGRAPSNLTFAARGGFLSIIKKQYRGSVRVEAANVVP